VLSTNENTQKSGSKSEMSLDFGLLSPDCLGLAGICHVQVSRYKVTPETEPPSAFQMSPGHSSLEQVSNRITPSMIPGLTLLNCSFYFRSFFYYNSK